MKISTAPIVDANGQPTGEGELTTIELTSDELGRAIRLWAADHLQADDYDRICPAGVLGPFRYTEVHIGGQSIDLISGARVVVKRAKP